MRAKLGVAIVMMGLAGCGAGAEIIGAETRAETTATDPTRSPRPARVPFPRPVEGRATSGRLATAEGATWVEVRVAGDDATSLRACEALVESERQARERGMDQLAIVDRVVITRPCAPTPLPPIEVDAGSHVLVHPRMLGAGDLVLLELDREVDGAITELHALPSPGECDALRARLHDGQARARAEAAEHAREWLEEQRARAAGNAERACAEVETIAQRCAAHRARSHARASCELERERAERACSSERRMLEVIEARAPEEPGPAIEPRCVAVD